MLSSGPQESSSKRKSAFELKNQLSDLQNKILDNQQLSKNYNKQANPYLTDMDSTGDNLGIPRLPNVFGKRKQKETSLKRNSLPVMPMSAGANTAGRTGNDVNFVVGLSENLLLECRRLTAESSEYKHQLKGAQEELDRVNKQLSNVTVINKKFMDEEDKLKDKNWELEASLQQLKEKLTKLSNDNQKLSALKIESAKVTDQLKNELELEKLSNLKLTEEVNSVRQQWASESKELKYSTESLNDENDTLHKSVMEMELELGKLREELKSKSGLSSVENDTTYLTKNDSDSDNEFSVIDDPSLSPMQDVTSRHLALERETIQSNLIHSNKTIAKLRSTILKLRTEKEELESKVTAISSSPNISAKFNTPVNKLKRGKGPKPRSLLSNRTVKTLTFEDNDSIIEDNWDGLSFNDSPLKAQIPNLSSSSEDDDKENYANRKLLSQELEQDPMDLINKYVSANNLLLVDANEYSRLQELDMKTDHHNRHNAAIITAAKKYNILALPRDDGSHHLQIPVLLLKEKCAEENLVLVEKDDYEELLSIKNHDPTEDELIERASRLNKVLIPMEEHEKLIHISESPSFDFLKTRLFEDFGQLPIHSTDLESLQNPPIDRVKELASSSEFDLVPVKEHKKLLQNFETPSFEFLRAQLYDQYNKVPIDLSELESLKNPSLDKLTEHASNAGHVIVPVDAHKDLIQKSTAPAIDDVKSFASSHGHTIVPKEDYQELQKQVTNPSTSQLYQYATALGMVLLSKEAHERLSNMIKTPSLQFLTARLRALDHVVIPSDQYEKLTTSSKETLLEKAERENAVIVPKDSYTALEHELEDLRERFSKPTLEYLKEMALSQGCVLVDSAEHKDFLTSLNTPLEDKAKANDKVLVDTKHHEELLKKAETPDLAFLEEKSKAHSMVLVHSDELADLNNFKQILESPSLEHLNSKAMTLNHKLISDKQLASLESLQTEEGIRELVTRKGFTLIETPQLQELVLLKEKIDNITVTDLQKYATKLNSSVIDTNELKSMKKLVENPTIEDLKLYESSLSIVVLPAGELEEMKASLNSPTVDYLTEKADLLNYKVIATSEFDDVFKNAHEPSIEHLSTKSKQHDHVVIPGVQLKSLEDKLENPEVAYLKDKASAAGYTLLKIEDATHLKKLSEESLEDKAAKVESVVVSQVDYERLSNLEANPNVSFLKEKLEILGYHLIDAEENKGMKEIVESPDLEFINKKAALLGLVAIQSEDYESLVRKTTNPTLEELRDLSSKKNMVLLSTEESELIEHPSVEALTEKALELDYSIIPTAKLNEMKESIESPSLPYILEKSQQHGHVLVSAEKHSQMESAISKPELAYIIEKADLHGHKVLPTESLAELNSLLSETAQEKAAKENLVVLTSEKHEDLVNLANETLDDKCIKLGHVALPKSEHEALLDSKNKLEYELLNFGEATLRSRAEALGLVALEKEEVDRMIASESQSLEDKAKHLGMVVLPSLDYEKLTHSLETPEWDYLIEKALMFSCSVIPTTELEAIKQKGFNPTTRDLEKHLKSRNSLILDQGVYTDLQSRLSNPDLEYLKEKASAIGHTLIPTDTHLSLVQLQEETLEEKAAKENYVVLPKSEHELLSLLQESPSLEFLKNGAIAHDHELISVDTLKELKDLNEEPLISKANKEGLILLSSDEYSGLKLQVENLEKQVQLTNEKSTTMDQAALLSLASAMNLVVLKASEYTQLSEAAVAPPLDQLKAHATKKDHTLLPNWKYEVLERRSNNPNEDEVETFASRIGKKLINADELERLRLEASNPSREVLSRAAVALGLVVVPTKEYDLLKSKFDKVSETGDVNSISEPVLTLPSQQAPVTPVKKSKVIDTKHQYEEMIKQENEKQEKQRVAASKALGIISLSTDEYKRLLAKLQVPDPTISEIYNGAKNFGLTVLPHADYMALLKKSHPDTREDLENAARLLGFSIMPLNLGRNYSAVSLTDDEQFHDAVSHQSSKISLISTDEYEDALSRQLTGGQADTVEEIPVELTLDHLKQKAAEFGYELVPMINLEESGGDETSIEDNDLEEASEPTVLADNDESLVQEKPLAVDSRDINTKTTPPVSDSKLSKLEIVELAAEYDLVVISKQEYEDLKKDPTDDQIVSILNSRNEIAIPNDKYNQLLADAEKSKELPTFSTLSSLALPLGLSVMPTAELENLKEHHNRLLSSEEIRNLAANEGLVTLTKAQHDELQDIVLNQSKPLDDEGVRKAADQLGMKLISNDEYAQLQNHKVTEMDIIESAPEFGLLVIAQSKLLNLKEVSELTQEQLESRSSELGLLLITQSKWEELQDKDITEGELRDKALALGLLVVPESEVTSKELTSTALTEEELRTRASEMGMSLVSNDAEKDTERTDISANELAMKAAELDLILISQTAYDDLKNSQASGEGIEEAAKKLGMLCIPESSYISTTVAPRPDPKSVVMIPKTYYNKLARSHAMSVERLSTKELIDFCQQRGLTVEGVKSGIEEPQRYEGTDSVPKLHQPALSSPMIGHSRSTTPLPNSPSSNMVSSPSQFSIATNVSLTDRKMIPALTQTIIGEHLYKYYRRLGRFSSISENRHERYFWIHPYSLTLYWSASNPILGDPSTNKTRAAAILGVEAVADNNPLPPGLYHKSIIIHSSDKSIKITCPTRQRHNVWLNSIRYLLERSSLGTDMSDVLENPPTAKMTDKIEEEDEENTNDDDIDTYRYVKPRASTLRSQRVMSVQGRKSSRVFSSPSIPRSSTLGSLRHKK